MGKKTKTSKLNFFLGIGAGIILYKVIFELIWPMIFD
tara:strand:+ start:190 stop:300 length:111 start_codon:yes stop_codon:yes gene_type:complete